MKSIIKKLQRHHYVPKFYLASWCIENDDLLLLHTKTSNGSIKSGLKSPYSVSYVRGLYTLLPEIHPFQKDTSDHIEASFFSKLDDDASKLYRRILKSGISTISAEDRYLWALFVNSLLERCPVRINEVISEANEHTMKMVEDFHRTGDPRVVQNAFKHIDVNALSRNAVLHGMVRNICDAETLEYFSRMHWATIDLPDGADHFLTGDTPIVVNGAQSEKFPVLTLSMALSPKKLLIMHANDEAFDKEFFSLLAFLHNILIVQQTQKYLISDRILTDDGYVKNKRIFESMFK